MCVAEKGEGQEFPTCTSLAAVMLAKVEKA